MGWLRIRPSPSSSGSLYIKHSSHPHSSHGPSSLDEQLTYYDFPTSRRSFSEGNGRARAVDLVSIGAVSPRRATSRSRSPSEVPHSEEALLDHATPSSSPPPLRAHGQARTLQGVNSTPAKSAIAFFEQKALGSMADQKLTSARTPPATPTTPSIRRHGTRSVPLGTDSEDSDSMASLVSMLRDSSGQSPETMTSRMSSILHDEQKPCLQNTVDKWHTWMARSPSYAIQTSDYFKTSSDSDSSLHALNTNLRLTPTKLNPPATGKHGFHLPFRNSNHSRSCTRTTSEMETILTPPLPCFLTPNNEFDNHPAVQNLSAALGLSGFVDGANSMPQSFSAPSVNRAHTYNPTNPGTNEREFPLTARSPQPVALSSGLSMSQRSLSRSSSSSSFFTRPPGRTSLGDMPVPTLDPLTEGQVTPQQSPSHAQLDVAAYQWDIPRTDSPASVASSSRRHSMERNYQRMPIKMDSAAHYPRPMSPPWERPNTSTPTGNNMIHIPPTIVTAATSDSDCDSPSRKRAPSIAQAPSTDLPPIAETSAHDGHQSIARNSPECPHQAPINPKSKSEDGSTFVTAGGTDADTPKESTKQPKTDATEKKKAHKHRDSASHLENDEKEKKPNHNGKAHKFIRYGRRLFLRSSVLKILVGRQLAGPVQDSLKAVTNLPAGTELPVGIITPVNVGVVAPVIATEVKREDGGKEVFICPRVVEKRVSRPTLGKMVQEEDEQGFLAGFQVVSTRTKEVPFVGTLVTTSLRPTPGLVDKDGESVCNQNVGCRHSVEWKHVVELQGRKSCEVPAAFGV